MRHWLSGSELCWWCMSLFQPLSFTGGSCVTGQAAVSFTGGSCHWLSGCEFCWWFMCHWSSSYVRDLLVVHESLVTWLRVLLVVHVSLVKWLMCEFY